MNLTAKVRVFVEVVKLRYIEMQSTLVISWKKSIFVAIIKEIVKCDI